MSKIVEWKAYADRIVIQVDAKVRETAGGILLPEGMKSVITVGTVLAAGPSAQGAQPGDRVFFLTKASLEIQPGIFSTLSDSVTAAQRTSEMAEPDTSDYPFLK